MSWFGIETRTSVPPIERGGWLDVMRIVVAILMILHHFELAGPSPTSELIPFFERGYLLTDFFLIDSGYVLARVYGERVLAGGMSLGDFFKKRFLRVVPAHLIMSLTLIGLVLVSGLLGVIPRNPEWFDWKELPAQFFLVQSYGVPGGRGWNAPSWSISALLGCYLMFPLLLRGMSRFNPYVALGLGIAVFTACNLATWAILNYPVYQMPLKFGIFRALPLFILGMALARFAQQVYLPERLAKGLGLVALAGFIGVQAFGEFSLISLSLICAMIMASGAIPVRRRSWLVEKAAVISFSVFITNEVVRIAWFGVVNQLIARFDLSQTVQWTLWGMGVTLALAFATAFHYAIDNPIQVAVNRPKKQAGRVRTVVNQPVPYPARSAQG